MHNYNYQLKAITESKVYKHKLSKPQTVPKLGNNVNLITIIAD